MSNPSQAFWRFYDVGPNDYVVGDAPVYPELYNVYVVYNDVSGMNTDGTYIIRYEWSGGATVDADNPGTWEEWKYVRSDGGDERHTYVRGYEGFGEDDDPEFSEVPFEGGNDPTEVFLSVGMRPSVYCDMVVAQADLETLQDKVPGPWTVVRTITGPGFTGTPEVIQEFDFRMIAIKNLTVDKIQVDPNSEDHTAKFRGDLVLLPGDWMPDDSQSWSYTGYDIDIFDDASNRVFRKYVQVHPVAMGGGKIGEIEVDWDGRYNDLGATLPDDEPVEGVFTARFFAGTRTEAFAGPPYILGTGTGPLDLDVQVCGCVCKCKSKSGNTFYVFDLMSGMLQSLVGPPLECVVSYCGNKKDNEPQSMGYGWSGPSTARVLEPVGQDGALVYRDDAGTNLRWELVGGNYVPVRSDNYIKIAKTGDPDATYVLTFQDQSQREFDEDGLLMRTLDRNGLAVTYQYTGGVLTSMTDATGQTLNFAFRGDGQLESVSCLSRVTTLEYNDDDRLEVITDPAGQTTTFVYNEEGLIWKIKDTRGQDAVTYEYDWLGREVSQQLYDQTLITTLYEGDDEGFSEMESAYNFSLGSYSAIHFADNYSCPRILVITEDLTEVSPTRVSVFFHDRDGNLVCRDDLAVPMGSFEGQEESIFNRTVMEFNDVHGRHLMSRMINPNLAETRYGYDDEGNVTRVEDHYGNTTEFIYAQEIDSPLNPLHKNLLRKVIRPGASLSVPSLEMVYDENGYLERVYDEKRNFTDYEVNALGLVESVTDRRGNTTTMTYDPTTHRLLTITAPSDVSDPNSGRTVTMGYDSFGNVNSIKDGLNNEVLYQFDAVDRVTQVTDARGKVVTMNYVDGLLDNVVAPANAGSTTNSRTTRFSYDNSGRLTLTESEVGVSTFQARVGYSYTGFSQLKQLKRWKAATQKQTNYAYDLLGRMTSSTDFGGRETVVDHAPFCVENQVTTPRGVLRKSSYDSLCQLVRLETNTESKRFWYDGRQRLIKVAVSAPYAEDGYVPQPEGFQPGRYEDSSWAIITNYYYNELDQLTRVEHSGGAIDYVYDEEENLIQITDTNGRVTGYSYFNDGRLFQVTHNGQVFTYSYDEVGRLLYIDYPASTKLVASFTKPDNSTGWNENGQLLSLRYFKDGFHFQSFEYSYDDSGNRIQMIDTPENTGNLVVWDYSYDWLNRLSEVKRGGLTTALYAYDESDNRIELQLPQKYEVWTYGYDIADRILSRSLNFNGSGVYEFETFEHDDDGNLTSRTLVSDTSTVEYVWDEDNRLTRIEQPNWMSAQYDFDGIRRKALHNGAGEVRPSRYFSSGGMSLSEEARDGTNVSFIQGHQILGLYDGTDYFYHISDGLGSIRMIVDEDGDAVASFSSDEFGVEETSSGSRTDLDFMTYVGGLGVRNDSSGLYYMRQRYYDPQLGRWLSADPIGFAGGANLYQYGESNPINWVDPDGLDPLKDRTGQPVQHEDSGNPEHPGLPKDLANLMKKTEDFVRKPGGNVVDKKWSRGYNCIWYAYDKAGLLSKHKPTWVTGTESPMINAMNKGLVTQATGPKDIRMNDLVLYADAKGKILHAGVVVKPNGINSMVEAKWGDMGVYQTPCTKVLPTYYDGDKGGQILILHVKR